MTDLKSTVASYYDHVDRADIDWILQLFSPTIIYERADAVYDGKDAVSHFFRAQRRISGRHAIETLWLDSESRCVFVTGSFSGVGESGDPRSVRFADIWHFDAAGLVGRRQTYLALGHSYVER